MYIHITESAAQRLQQYPLANKDRIRLVYDTEGCGCAVSGVVTIWIVNNTVDDEEDQAETNLSSLPIFFMKRHEVFLDDKLRLDYSPERLAFRLSSAGQIYGNGITIQDLRPGPA